MQKLSLQCWEGEKNHCSYYSTFDILYTTASCSVFTAQKACTATSVFNLFAASDKPKTSSHLFSPKDTRLFKGVGGSFQQLQQQFHLAHAACRSQQCHSEYIGDNLDVNMDLVVQWIRGRTMWKPNCDDSEDGSERQRRKRKYFQVPCLTWRQTSAQRPGGFCCCHVAPFCCQCCTHSSVNILPTR